MKQQTAKVVVGGGGFGAVKTALQLANKPGVSVQLISDNTHFEYHGALYRSAVGHSPMEVVIPLREIFAGAKNVAVILDSIGFIDPQKKRIASLTGNIYNYDQAVFALGNTSNYYGIHGLKQHTASMQDVPSTIKLRKQLVELFKEPHAYPIRIAVVGAGATGVELAGEIPTFARLIAKKYGRNPQKVKIILVDSANRILPMLSEKASKKVTRHLQEMGVEIHLNTRVESGTIGNLRTTAGNLSADLIAWTAGSRPVNFYANNPAVFTLGRGGRVVVDDHLQVAGQEDIYVIGDNADTQYSGMAQTALYDANFVAKNILTTKMHAAPAPYKNRKPLYVVTAGPKWAVVQEGNKVISGYRGWLIRQRADLAIFNQFEPYEQAIKIWRSTSKMSQL